MPSKNEILEAIEKAKSINGFWSDKQIECLGEKPRKGWKKIAINSSHLTYKDLERMIALKDAHINNSVKKMPRKNRALNWIRSFIREESGRNLCRSTPKDIVYQNAKESLSRLGIHMANDCISIGQFIDSNRQNMRNYIKSPEDFSPSQIKTKKVRARIRRIESEEKKRIRNQSIEVNSEAFLSSYEWRSLRMKALVKHGAKCQCCGNTPANGAVMNVDHIKPRRTHPELALELSNLQILCNACNHGKGNWDQTDWR